MKNPPDYVPGHGLLRGKSVLVTAAAGAGIGFAVAKRAAEEGCRALFISDVHERRLNEAVQTLQKETGLQAIYSQLCDVSQEAQVQALIDQANQTMGGIDVLVNNAGLGTSKKIVDMADEEWDKVIGVTLTGTFRVTRAALKVMQPQGKGVIVNNASVLGWRAQTEQAHYAAAKAGVAGMTRALARELGSRNITVNCVAPGFIETDMTAALGDEQQKALLGQIPLGHLGKPSDIAHAVAYLASPQASYVTGQELHVNGGMYM